MVVGLIGGSNFKNSISHKLGSLFNLLHLLADPCPGCFVPALRLIDISFNLSDQHFKIFIFLHQSNLHIVQKDF